MITWLKRWLHDPDDPDGMWRIGPAIGITLSVALCVAATLIVAGYVILDPGGELSVSDFVDIVVIILGVIAGGGGSVALVVAYRRQKVNEDAERRAAITEQRLAAAEQHERALAKRSHDRDDTRLLNERFRAASEQLGHNSAPVRLAGAHAMASLADDWDERARRQMCIDVLCSYLRHAGKRPTGDDDAEAQRAWDTDREVRHTILHLIANRLRNCGPWTGQDFDLTGVMIDVDIDLSRAKFKSSYISFRDAEFSRYLNLYEADFGGGIVDFGGASFGDGWADFGRARFGSDGCVSFIRTKFTGAEVHFDHADFAAHVQFVAALFAGGEVICTAKFCSDVSFSAAELTGGIVSFAGARFIRGTVDFCNAAFSGSLVSFRGARFDAGSVDIPYVRDWSTPPVGLPEMQTPDITQDSFKLTVYAPAEDSESTGHHGGSPDMQDGR